MLGLKVEIWEHWEELCCYFMEQIAHKHDPHIKYQCYGHKGQSQFGVDLVPKSSDFPLVGQCKLRETSFTWKQVLDELEKTDGHAGKIQGYVIFTTAHKHTTIQDQQNSGSVYRHKRPDGSSFSVHVKHWADYSADDLKSIPQDVLQRIFPNAYSLSVTPQAPSNDDYMVSLAKLRSYVPTCLSVSDLHWLEQYDFTLGWIPELAFDAFRDLHRDVEQVEDALRFNIKSWLHQEGSEEIKASLLAGKDFYDALKVFVNGVQGQIVGDNLPDGTSILTVTDQPRWEKHARQFASDAQYLANVYRMSILGERVRN